MVKAVHALYRRRGRLVGLMSAGWLIACAPSALPLPQGEGEPVHIIYVTSNGWHTGIVLSRDMLPPGPIPETADFPEAAYLEFGWGDREYYPSPQPSMSMALSAALTPTPAVMHLAGLPRPPQEHYREAEVLAMRLSAAALARLITEIDLSFDRPQGGRGEALARGLYRDSWFYPAHGRFHLFNTCNNWTARMLSAAGVGVSLSGVLTAEDLMGRLRNLANVRQLTLGQNQTLLDQRHDPRSHVGEALVPGLAAPPADVDLLQDDGDLEGAEDAVPQ